MDALPTAAARFRHLHQHGLLRLANAWDAGTARLIESVGAPAVATTSAGLAWSQGYPDGDQLPISVFSEAVAGIARVVRVPLTIDIEGGYSDDPAAVAHTVLQLVRAGVAGINLEDGAGDPALLATKIRHVREACLAHGVDVFINARTDVFLRSLVADHARIGEVLARAARYREAGADGLFVPALVDADGIRRLATEAGMPLNVMLRPQLQALDTLQAWGVRRISTGSALAESMYGQLRGQVDTFLHADRTALPDPQAMGYGAINALFA
ncbi:isocitrate lyase/phosphoenolpyruvate mutase family protein [Pseudoxanthomonas sp. SL93]|uniref:isocitrate lyase/PEP mutase family protein n=1 Tax=Pseudoxanthomonas sp. SL93 TaxID=2995142 RepID=UPI00226DE2AB|nr:isocitrate lyase/phosphoenolpyruvate mutase family protein [Pseudoxanthomonas sp. SL93]WAC63909.1 isocitrate lyase/phosphoenolpyruvate mutase family protein [Pseudoxanthomonas sp. SL93]